eukprot:m.147705 g.147705  ORF g.147705 m.147705 type:complete len:748 (+) comp30555_c0_seq2:224-2467(+)
MEEAKFIKRTAKAARLDVHPTENAIVINYEVEAVILADSGEPMIAHAKRCQKNIKVRSLTERTDIEALALNIMERCKLITPQKFHELLQLLAFLQTRAQDAQFVASIAKTKEAQRQQSLLDHGPSADTAKIGDIDDYMALLYEDHAKKIEGTAMILQITQNPDNLEEMIQNETLLGCLARVLRDEGLKSMELANNIIHVFYILSSFTVFHDFLKQYKIGALCMKIVTQEMQRYDVWQEKMKKSMKKLASKPEEAESLVVKFNDQCFKQESLLYVAVHLLLNLAEDTRVQIKMKNKNIVQDLIKLLDRDNVEFLELIVNFLKKLSIFAENKDEMKEADIVKKLVRLVNSPPDEMLSKVTLGLLLNLSFDRDLRTRIVELGLLPRLMDLAQIREGSLRVIASILFNLSTEDDNKSHFSDTECIPVMMEEIIHPSEEDATMHVLALFINLAMEKKNAVKMCLNHGLDHLIKIALFSADVKSSSVPTLVMKLIRNISRHDGDVRKHFEAHKETLVEAAVTNPTNESMLVEILGVLGNLTFSKELLLKYDVVGFVIQGFAPAAYDDDIVLQLIILVGAILSDEDCAELVATSGVTPDLDNILNTRDHDDEIVLQIVYVYYKLLYFKATRTVVMESADTMDTMEYLLRLMDDDNAEIKKVCNGALEIAMQFDDEIAERVKEMKFEAHNGGWITAMKGNDGQFYDDAPNDGYYADDGQGFVYDTSDLDRYGPGAGDYDSAEEDELDYDAGDWYQ